LIYTPRTVSIFKSKHSLIAMVVAPVLAVGAYFAIDVLVGEKPHVAQEGQSYPLVEMPNCRYDSGGCGLKNSDFRLDLTPRWLDEDRLLLSLESVFPLEGVKLALAGSGADQEPPVEMRSLDKDGLTWSVEVDCPDPENSRLHLVASANRTLYFGDAALKFTLKAKL